MKLLFLVTRSRGPTWDENKQMRAQAQWPDHATFMNQLAADGFVVLGGPIEESGDVMLVIDAADEDEIHTTLARDPWNQSGILAIRHIRRWTVLLQAG